MSELEIEKPLEAIIAEAFDFPMFKIYNVRGTELVIDDDEAASTDEEGESPPTAKRARSEPSAPAGAPKEATSSKSTAPVPSQPEAGSKKAAKGAAALPPNAGKKSSKARRRRRPCRAAEVEQAIEKGDNACACMCKKCVDKRLAYYKTSFPKSMKLGHEDRRAAELGDELPSGEPGVLDACPCCLCARRRVNEYERGTGRCAAADAKATCQTCKCATCEARRIEMRIDAYENMSTCECQRCKTDMERFSKGWPNTRSEEWDDFCACTECFLRRIDEHETVMNSIKEEDKQEKEKAEKAEQEAKNPSFEGLSGLAGALSAGVNKSSKAAKRKAAARKAALMRGLASKLTKDISEAQLKTVMGSDTVVLSRDVSAVTPLEYQQRWSAFDALEQLGIKATPQMYVEHPESWKAALELVAPRVESAKQKGNTLFSAKKLPLAFRSYWSVAQLLHALQHMFFGDFLPAHGLQAIQQVLGKTAAAALCNCLYVATTLKMWDEAEFAARMCTAGWCSTFPKHLLRLSALLEELGHSHAAHDAVKAAPGLVDLLVQSGDDLQTHSGVVTGAEKRQAALLATRDSDVQRYGHKTNFEGGEFVKRHPLTNALLCGSFQVLGLTDSVTIRQFMQRVRAALLCGDEEDLSDLMDADSLSHQWTILYVCPSTGSLRFDTVEYLLSYEDLAESLDDDFCATVNSSGRSVWGYPLGSAGSLAERGEGSQPLVLASAALHYFSIGTCGNSFMDAQFASYAAHYKRCVQEHLDAGHEWGTFGCDSWACTLDKPLQPYYGLRFARHTRSATALALPARAADAPKPAGDELFAAYGFSCPQLEGTDAYLDSWEVLPGCKEQKAYKLPGKYTAAAASGAGGAAAAGGGGSGVGAKHNKCPACAVPEEEVAAMRRGNSGHVIKRSEEGDEAVRQNLMKSPFMQRLMSMQKLF